MFDKVCRRQLLTLAAAAVTVAALATPAAGAAPSTARPDPVAASTRVQGAVLTVPPAPTFGPATTAGPSAATAAAQSFPVVGKRSDQIEAFMLNTTNSYRAVGRWCPTDANDPYNVADPAKRVWMPAAPALRRDQRLVNSALAHSADMGARNFYAHNNPDGATDGQRMAAAGFTWSWEGENIWAYYDDAATIMDGWIRHEGHCQNIMNAHYGFVGNGYAYSPNSPYGHYYTQDFAAPLTGAGMTFAPDAPTITSASAGDAKVTVNVSPPNWNGGLALINYRVSVDGGATWTLRSPPPPNVTAPTTFTVNNLTNGRTYQLAVSAVNDNFFRFGGASPPSNVVTVTPFAAVPARAAITSAVPSATSVAVAVNVAPGGGAPATFQYSTDGGSTWRTYTGTGMSTSGGVMTLTGLAAGQTVNVAVRAVNAAGAGAASATVGATPYTPTASVFVPIDPARVVDTRPAAGGTSLAAGVSRVFSVANELNASGGRLNVVPAGAVAVAYNLTAPASATSGHLRVTPGDLGVTDTEGLTFRPGAPIANGLTTKLDTSRQIRIFNDSSAPADAVVDVVGYFIPAAAAPAGGKFTAITPVRVYDSNSDSRGLIGYTETREIDVTRALGTNALVVPDTTMAVTYNVTVVEPSTAGHLRVFPGNLASSAVSTINWAAPDSPTSPRDKIANGITVRLSPTGTVKVYSRGAGATRFLIDIVGYYRPGVGAQFYPTVPARAYDSRAAAPAQGKLAYGSPGRVVSVADARDPNGAVVAAGVVPAGATAMAYNVTASSTSNGGHLRLYPADVVMPNSSVLNWPDANYTRSNGNAVAISTDRKVGLYTSARSIDVIVDTAGYYR